MSGDLLSTSGIDGRASRTYFLTFPTTEVAAGARVVMTATPTVPVRLAYFHVRRQLALSILIEQLVIRKENLLLGKEGAVSGETFVDDRSLDACFPISLTLAVGEKAEILVLNTCHHALWLDGVFFSCEKMS